MNKKTKIIALICSGILVLIFIVYYYFFVYGFNTTVESCVYELQETDEPVKPCVVLKDHEQFVFTYSSLSSYLPIGTYEINKNNLILETDDGKYQYIFEIKNNTLIFNKEESSSISLGDIEDGSVFVLQEK